jgi:hypothetical protein
MGVQTYLVGIYLFISDGKLNINNICIMPVFQSLYISRFQVYFTF